MQSPPQNKSNTWLAAFSGQDGRKPWGSLALSFVLVVLAAGLVWGAHAFSKASSWVAHTNQVRLDVESVLIHLNEAESSHRGYLLSGDTALRRQSLMAQAKAIDISKKLPSLVSDNPEQEIRAKRLAAFVEERFRFVEIVAAIYDRQGFENAHKQWMEMRLESNLPQQTRDLVTQMVNEEHRLLEKRQAQTTELSLLVEVAALLGMSVAVALVILSGLAYRREARIRDRASRATQVAHDELALSLAAIEREHSSTQALADFSGLLQGCQTIEEIMEVSVHAIIKILPGTAGSFYLMRASRDHAEAQSDWGDYWKGRPDTIVPNQCWALRQGRPFRSNERSLVCAHRASAEIPNSTCVPMMVQGSEVGLLFVQHSGTWTGTPMAEAAAEQLALAITNLRLRETLRTQSLRDPLTGLSNRREFDEQMPKEIARSQRSGQPLSLLVMDIDHFKRFNDTYGHDAGDAVLREFSHLVKKFVRTEDMVARMGGEEFMVVLPGTNIEEALTLSERLRQQVEMMEVVHRGVGLGKITTSIGIAECPVHANDASSLIATADAALYRAKARGRNRVEVADGSFDLPGENASNRRG